MIIKRKLYSNPLFGTAGNSDFQAIKKESWNDTKNFFTGKPREDGSKVKFTDLLFDPNRKQRMKDQGKL